MNYILRINRRILMVILVLLIIVIALFIWYNEEGANNEAPKKATLVMETIKGSGYYKYRKSLHKP